MVEKRNISEACRLENLWSNDFGDEYTERNKYAGGKRTEFWENFLIEYEPVSVLEVGCNLGANLLSIAERISAKRVYGTDINSKALRKLRTANPDVNALWSPARQLPFRDLYFDMVFTLGVLIHQPETTLPIVMAEIVRCAKRYVLCGEYYAEETTEVPYRGQAGALFKREYGKIYQDLFPELKLIRKEYLGPEQGFDNITLWLFGK